MVTKIKLEPDQRELWNLMLGFDGMGADAHRVHSAELLKARLQHTEVFFQWCIWEAWVRGASEGWNEVFNTLPDPQRAQELGQQKLTKKE